MSTNKRVAAASGASRSSKTNKPTYVSQYLGIDTHLSKRNGSTDQVFGIANERPAGRKLAEDITAYCNKLDAEGYEVISIFPLTSGRAVAATVEAAERVQGRTYSRREIVQTTSNSQGATDVWASLGQRHEDKHFVDTGIGYSVTDGVVITAKLLH